MKTATIAICCWLGLQPVCATAQSVPLALELASSGKKYEENFRPGTRSAQPQVVAPRGLVGLHLGQGTGEFRIDGLRVRLPAATAPASYCIKLVSVDGMYWSLNPYRRASSGSGESLIETNSKYASMLARAYQSSELIARSIASPACTEDASGPFLPVIPPGAKRLDTLFVYFNSPGDRLAARLLDGQAQQVAGASCSNNDDDSAVYSQVCEFPFSAAVEKQAVKLQIEIAGSGRRSLQYDLQTGP
jgi:hypothetical protein